MIDTIAAIATPPGRGGVGIVRVSGPEAPAILARLVPDWPGDQPSHMLRLSRIVDPQGALIDESLVVLMRAPRSYTAEDVVELQCHGGPMILRRVLDAALLAGARMAAPGEFTQRAFLNGRLDLTQAEAVADLIEATSEQAHRLALEHLQGNLGDAMRAHLERLIQVAVLIESALDFSHEEHVYQIERDEILERLDAVEQGLTELRERFDQGRRQREGVRVVIAGPTNAGKSTLFNVLCGTERAIVTDIAGTTRDFLEEQITLSGALLRLIDTAGLRETEDRVEALGIERSRAWVEDADVLVWMVDGSRPLEAEERDALTQALSDPRPTLVLQNKRDQGVGLGAEDSALLARFPEILETSLVEGTGVEALRGWLGRTAEALTTGEGVLLSRARHLGHVLEALAAIERAREAIGMSLDHELVAIDVREAIDALGEITGRVTTDDILNRIFSDFCVGK